MAPSMCSSRCRLQFRYLPCHFLSSTALLAQHLCTKCTAVTAGSKNAQEPVNARRGMDALLWDHSINEDAKEVPQGLKPEEEITRFSVRRCSCIWCSPLGWLEEPQAGLFVPACVDRLMSISAR